MSIYGEGIEVYALSNLEEIKRVKSELKNIHRKLDGCNRKSVDWNIERPWETKKGLNDFLFCFKLKCFINAYSVFLTFLQLVNVKTSYILSSLYDREVCEKLLVVYLLFVCAVFSWNILMPIY